MKTFVKLFSLSICTLLICTTCYKKEPEIHKVIDYSSNNLVCGVENPLTDLEWLKNYCEEVQETQDLLSARIDLYKVIGKENEHIFFVEYSTEDDYAISTQLNCINCYSDTVFRFSWMTGKGNFFPHLPNPILYKEFIKDKEYVSEIFHFVKQ